MMPTPAARRLVLAGALGGFATLGPLLGGCAGSAPASHRDAAALTACRQRADEIYQKQNRAELYRSDVFATSSRDAPFATTGLPGITTRGLSGAYERETLVDDCLNAQPATAPAPASAAPPGAGPKPAAGGLALPPGDALPPPAP